MTASANHYQSYHCIELCYYMICICSMSGAITVILLTEGDLVLDPFLPTLRWHSVLVRMPAQCLTSRARLQVV
jgi:hypothetical protein